MKKFLALLLSVAMLLSVGLTPARAAEPDAVAKAPVQFADMSDDHWAKSSIDRWSGYGIVNGDEHGHVNADKPLRRCEMAQVLVNLLGLTQEAENTFGDLTGKEWYAGTILKCAAAGIMKGDGVNCNAVAPVSREEAIVMFGRAIGVRPAANPDLTKFEDAGDVASWAAPYMAPLTQMGILNGVEDGSKVAPKGEMNRASTFALLDKAITVYASEPGEYQAADPNGCVVVTSAAEEAGQVVISGETAGVVVSKGTTDAVAVKDLVADTVKVDAPVDVTVEGRDTVLGSVQLNDAATVDVAKGVQVDTLEANAPATVTNKGTVDNLIANDAVKVDNQGTVKDVAVNASDVVVDGKAPQKMDVAEGVSAPTNSQGDTVKPSRPSSGGSTASGPSTPVTTLYTVTVAQPTGVELHADPTRAEAGATITVTAATKDGYELQDVIYSVSEDVSHNVVMKSSGANAFRGTFTMPAGNVRVSATAKAVTPVTPVGNEYTIEVDTAAGGTIVTDPAGKAEEGATVRVTATPDNGYELDTLTYTPEGGNPVDIKANKSFTMPGKAVTVSGSFKAVTVTPPTPDEVDKSALETAIADANTAMTGVIGSEATDPSQVDKDQKYVPATVMQNTKVALAAAEAVKNNANATQAEVNQAVKDLNTAVRDFTVAIQTGTKTDEPVNVPVESVSLDKATATIDMATSTTLELTATVAPNNATNKTVTWTSSDTAVATVQNGTVTAVGVGEATITAAADNKTASCTVTVINSKPTVSTPAELTAALADSNVTEITVSANFNNGTSDAKADYEVYTVDRKVAIKGENKTSSIVQGSFAVTKNGSGSTFDTLTIKNYGCKDGTARRGAITAYVDALTVNNCVLQCGASTELGNGLVLLPSATEVKYTVTGNTFHGYQNNTTTADGTTWTSTGMMISAGVTKDFLGMDASTKSVLPTIDAETEKAFITGNTFTQCKVDYVRETWDGSYAYYTRGNSCGTNLSPASAASTGATIYISGPMTRNGDTTIKTNTKVVFLDDGNITMKNGSRLLVQHDAQLLDASGKELTSLDVYTKVLGGDVVAFAADANNAYDVQNLLASQIKLFEGEYYNGMNGAQRTHFYDKTMEFSSKETTNQEIDTDKENYLFYVGEMDVVNSLKLNDETDALSLTKEVRISIGHDNFLHTAPYVVENGKVYVNSILLAAKAKATNGTVTVNMAGKNNKSNGTQVDATLTVTYKLFDYPAENNLFVTAVAAPDAAGGVEFKDNTPFTGSNTTGYTVEGTFTNGQHERVLMGVNLSTDANDSTTVLDGTQDGVGPVIVYEENSTRYVLGFTELGENLYDTTYSYGTYPVFSSPAGGTRTVTVLIPGAGSVKITFTFTEASASNP